MEKSFWIFNFPFLCIHAPFLWWLFLALYIYIYIFRKRIDIRYQGDSSILPAAFECVKMNRDRGIQPKRVWIIYGWRTENRETKQTFEPKITIMNHLSKWILHSFEIYWNSSEGGGGGVISILYEGTTQLFPRSNWQRTGRNFQVSIQERSTTDRTSRVFIRQTVSSLSHGNFAI